MGTTIRRTQRTRLVTTAGPMSLNFSLTMHPSVPLSAWVRLARRSTSLSSMS